jgi:hypothetical protein
MLNSIRRHSGDGSILSLSLELTMSGHLSTLTLSDFCKKSYRRVILPARHSPESSSGQAFSDGW